MISSSLRLIAVEARFIHSLLFQSITYTIFNFVSPFTFAMIELMISYSYFFCHFLVNDYIKIEYTAFILVDIMVFSCLFKHTDDIDT